MHATLSEDRLAHLHEIMIRHVERGAAPGLVSVVARGGDAHVDVMGTAALAGGRLMGPDTIFRISSITKPITAVATLILLEDAS